MVCLHRRPRPPDSATRPRPVEVPGGAQEPSPQSDILQARGSRNNCGASCIRCDAPIGGSATCDGAKCGAPTCPASQQICNNACIDKARSCDGFCSNGKYNCPDGVCRDTNNVTSWRNWLPAVRAEGQRHASAELQWASACGYACNTGYLLCGDGSCARASWDFETGDLQGVYGVSQNPAVSEMVSVRTDHVHGGTYVLFAGRLLQNGQLLLHRRNWRRCAMARERMLPARRLAHGSCRTLKRRTFASWTNAHSRRYRNGLTWRRSGRALLTT